MTSVGVFPEIWKMIQFPEISYKSFHSLNSLYCIIPQDFESDFMRYQIPIFDLFYDTCNWADESTSLVTDSERLKFVTIFRPLWLSEKGWIAAW